MQREWQHDVNGGDSGTTVAHLSAAELSASMMSHVLLAHNLGDDIVAQRSHGVCGVGQAAATKVGFRARFHPV